MTELCLFYMSQSFPCLCRHFFHDVITACTVFHCRQGTIRNLQKPASPKLRSRHLRATEGSALIQLKAGRNQEVQVRSRFCQLKQIYEISAFEASPWTKYPQLLSLNKFALLASHSITGTQLDGSKFCEESPTAVSRPRPSRLGGVSNATSVLTWSDQ
jgi:hypothetical protein